MLRNRKNTPNTYYVLRILGAKRVENRIKKVIEKLNQGLFPRIWPGGEAV